MLLSEPAKAGYGLKKLTLACFCVWLSACSTWQKNDATEPVSFINMEGRKAAQVLEDTPDKKAEGRTLLEHRGTGSFVRPPTELQRVKPAGDEQTEMVKVSFEGAPVGAVLEAILGDFLKVPYSLEGEVQGQITLVSTDPVPQEALFDPGPRGV